LNKCGNPALVICWRNAIITFAQVKHPVMIKRLIIVLTGLILMINPIQARAYDWLPNTSIDTIKISRDSLWKLVKLKDSLLITASLDSLFTAKKIIELNSLNDSLSQELRHMIYTRKLDSIIKSRRDSLNREFNRFCRMDFRDSLMGIDEDSVKYYFGNLLDVVFHDSAYSPNGQKLRRNLSKLFYHLRNDSTSLWIHTSQRDSIPIILKDDLPDSTAFFLVNSKSDSAKIYIHNINENTIQMRIDDDFKLSHLLKRTPPPDYIHVSWKDLQSFAIPVKKVPPLPPKQWTTGGNFDVQLNQAAFHKWAKGGENRGEFRTTSTAFANFIKGKMVWNSDYSYRYGVIKSEGSKLRKNIDQLRVKSSFQHKAFKNYNYAMNLQFDSQLFEGFAYPNDSVPVSKFMGPGTLKIDFGMVYTPQKYLSLSLSPVGGKFTAVLDTLTISAKRYGLKAGQRIRSELVASFNLKYKKTLWKNIIMNTQLNLTSNYLEHPEKIDLDWQTNFTLKVNKYVSTKLFIYFLYDDDMIIPLYEYVDGKKTKVGEGTGLQIQQTFGIAFNYYL